MILLQTSAYNLPCIYPLNSPRRDSKIKKFPQPNMFGGTTCYSPLKLVQYTWKFMKTMRFGGVGSNGVLQILYNKEHLCNHEKQDLLKTFRNHLVNDSHFFCKPKGSEISLNHPLFIPFFSFLHPQILQWF